MKTLLILFSSIIALVIGVSIVESAGLPGWTSILVVGIAAFATSLIPKGSLAITCGAITMGADVNCNYPVTGGTDDLLYLINFTDLVSVTRNSTNPLIIESITMKMGPDLTSGTLVVGQKYKITTFNSSDDFTNVGAASNANDVVFVATGTTPTTWTNASILNLVSRAYVFSGQLGSLKPKWTVVKQTYTRPYDHQIDFAVFDATAAQKQNIAELIRGRVVAIVMQNYEGDSNKSAKIEIYGLDTGLIIDAGGRDLSKTDTGSAIELTLKTSDQAKEPRPAANYFHTDATTSRTEILALVS